MDANCSEYVWNNPTLFFKSYYVKITKTGCKTDVLNHLILVITLSTILGFILSLNCKNKEKLILTILLFNLAYSIYWYFRLSTTRTVKQKQVENFVIPVKKIIEEKEDIDEVIGDIDEVIGDTTTYPSEKNPFMNVLINEIKYNPTRPAAASITEPFVSTNLDLMFKTQFVNDPTDVFGRSQSQRQFYTTPSTTVPNDQDSYQNWLYRIPGKTCKEGGREACAAQTGSAGAIVPWLSSS